MRDGCAVVDRARCIGCGLCVPTCDAQAIRLRVKEARDRREPPLRLSRTCSRASPGSACSGPRAPWTSDAAIRRWAMQMYSLS